MFMDGPLSVLSQITLVSKNDIPGRPEASGNLGGGRKTCSLKLRSMMTSSALQGVEGRFLIAVVLLRTSGELLLGLLYTP